MAADVLLVEDDPSILEFTTLVLESAGYSVRLAINGLEALDLIYQQQPNLILLDLMMPVMDGLSLGQALRGDERTRDIPIVIFSAYPGGWLRPRSLTPRAI